MSHELKTPLTSVRMAIHLLLDEDIGTLSEKQVEVLIAAEEDAERLHRILENLLDIDRIESGKARLDFQSISSHVLAFEAVEPFRSSCQDHGVNLNVEIPDDLPEVWADPIRVTHVFANCSPMLSNTRSGRQHQAFRRGRRGLCSLFRLRYGQGIPERYLERVFERFFRISDRETESGAGLGLAIAKEIVRHTAANIHVESRETEGSTFTFSLKRADRIFEEDKLNMMIPIYSRCRNCLRTGSDVLPGLGKDLSNDRRNRRSHRSRSDRVSCS